MDLFESIFFNVIEFQNINNFLSSGISASFFRFNREDMNEFGVNFFDFNSSEFGDNNGRSLRCSIKNESQVEFLLNINSFMD